MQDLKKLTEETIKLVINNRFAPKSNKTNSVVQDDFINLMYKSWSTTKVYQIT
jgi:hypothetical protein